MTKRRAGVIGLGTIAPYFVDALNASARWDLAAVCDLRPDRLDGYAGTGIATYMSYEDILERGAVDAVVVTLPNDLHQPVVAAALGRGIHVCCEKPLTTRRVDAYALADLALRHEMVLLTASHRRYNSNVARLATTMPVGVPVRRVVSRYYELIEEHVGDDEWYLDPQRCGGGCVIDNGPNAIDAVRRVVGEVEVVACDLADIRSGTEFRARIDLRTPAGAPVIVDLDWSHPGQVKDLAVELADGRILRADMLGGYEGLKGSLPHEYAGIVEHFAELIDAPTRVRDDGPRIVDLIERAYALGRAG